MFVVKLRNMYAALRKKYTRIDRRPSYVNRHLGETFLIFGNGPSLTTHHSIIEAYLKSHRCITVGTNNIFQLRCTDYIVFTNSKRFRLYGAQAFKTTSKIFLSPYIQGSTKGNTQGFEKIAYLNKDDLSFSIDENGVILTNCRSTLPLSVALAVVMGAKKICLAGADGYPTDADESGGTHFYGGRLDEEKDGVNYHIELNRRNRIHLQNISEFMVSRGLDPITYITPSRYQ